MALMGLKLKKNYRVEYNLNADDTAGWQTSKEFTTLAGAQAHITRWLEKSGRGAIMQVTRIGDRV